MSDYRRFKMAKEEVTVVLKTIRVHGYETDDYGNRNVAYDVTVELPEGFTWSQFLNSTYNIYNWYWGEMTGSGYSAGQTNGYAVIIDTNTYNGLAEDNGDYLDYYYLNVNLNDEISSNDYAFSTKTFTTKEDTNVCLIKGDKILLADGSYKNVEDVTYNDLLVTYDFTTGRTTFNYPGLIIHYPAKERLVVKLNFENNITLYLTSRHHLYEYNRNMFSTIDIDKGNLRELFQNFYGTYYSKELNEFIPLKLLSFDIEDRQDCEAYDIQVSGLEVIVAEGLLSGNDVMNLFPREDTLLFNQELCTIFKNHISDKEWETTEYNWFKNNVTTLYPFWAWRTDYMWAFHLATELSNYTEEQKAEIYKLMEEYIIKTIPFILPRNEEDMILNINGETIIKVKFGDKIILPDNYDKYYDNSTIIYYDKNTEFEILNSTYLIGENNET